MTDHSGRPVRMKRLAASLLLAIPLLAALLAGMRAAADPVPHLGYGFNVAPWDVALLQSMGFNWMKVFDAPGSVLPVNVLLRVNAQASDLGICRRSASRCPN